MNKDAAAPGLKQRVTHELKSYAVISTYLAILFCAIVAYTNLVTNKFDTDPLNYTFALINALVIGKVILIGEMMHLGRRVESRPLYQSAILKAVLFGILVFLFHLIEEFVKRLYHHQPTGTVLRELELETVVARSIIVLCAFIPLFAFRELGRVLGEEKLHTILTQRSTVAPEPSLAKDRSPL